MRNRSELELIETSNELIINQKWFHWGGVIMLFFSSLLLFYLTYFIFKRREEGVLSLLLFVLFSSSFLISTYVFFARLLNKTIIVINKKEIVIRHQPIPWLNRTIELKDVERLEIKESKQSVGRTPGINYITIYSVVAYMRTGRSVTVVNFVPVQYYTYEQVKTIYQKMIQIIKLTS